MKQILGWYQAVKSFLLKGVQFSALSLSLSETLSLSLSLSLFPDYTLYLSNKMNLKTFWLLV